jgi:hypothetical protein
MSDLIDGDWHAGSIDNERDIYPRRAAGGRFRLGKYLGGGQITHTMVQGQKTLCELCTRRVTS